MSTQRKTQRTKVKRAKGKRELVSMEGFQERLMALVEWLADKDPVRAARLIGEYLDDLADEVANPPKPAKG